MTDLPPLPQADIWVREDFGLGDSTLHIGYTADQMRAYGAACAAQEREECEIKVAAAGMRRVKALDLREEVERLRAAAEQARAALSLAEPALELGLDALRESADRYHAEMKGYRPERHQMLEDDYTRAEVAWKAARDALRALDAALEAK